MQGEDRIILIFIQSIYLFCDMFAEVYLLLYYRRLPAGCFITELLSMLRLLKLAIGVMAPTGQRRGFCV